MEIQLKDNTALKKSSKTFDVSLLELSLMRWNRRVYQKINVVIKAPMNKSLSLVMLARRR